MAPQSLSLYDELTCAENLAFFARMYGLAGRKLHERIDWGLEFAGLEERRKSKVKTFSGGMKRRLNLACALAHEPDIVLLDEPTVGVDPQSRNHIFERIEVLKKAGLTVIYTTHYMEEAERLCDRVAIMDRGSILALGTIDTLISAHGGTSVVMAELKEPPGEGGEAGRATRRHHTALGDGEAPGSDQRAVRPGRGLSHPADTAARSGDGLPGPDRTEASRRMKAVLHLALKDLKLLSRDKFGMFWGARLPAHLRPVLRGHLQLRRRRRDGGDEHRGHRRRSVHRVGCLRRQARRIGGPQRQPGTDGGRSGGRGASRPSRRLRASSGGVWQQPGIPVRRRRVGGESSLVVHVDPARKAEAGYLQGMIMEAMFTSLRDRFMDQEWSQAQVQGQLDQLRDSESIDPVQKMILMAFMNSLNSFLGEFDPALYGEGLNLSAEKAIEFVDEEEEVDESVPQQSFEITFPQAILWGILGCTSGFAITIVKERREGTFLRLRVSPLSRAHILAGKGLACFIAVAGGDPVIADDRQGRLRSAPGAAGQALFGDPLRRRVLCRDDDADERPGEDRGGRRRGRLGGPLSSWPCWAAA